MRTKANAIGRLSTEDYREICGLLCPYCRAGISEVHTTASHDGIHSVRTTTHHIPGASDSWRCLAETFRNAAVWEDGEDTPA